MIDLLSQTAPTVTDFSTFGMAGLMGAMWLWERNASRQREQQLDEAHTRITGDRVQLDLLIDVVKQNSEAMTRLTTTQEQLLMQIGDIGNTGAGQIRSTKSEIRNKSE